MAPHSCICAWTYEDDTLAKLVVYRIDHAGSGPETVFPVFHLRLFWAGSFLTSSSWFTSASFLQLTTINLSARQLNGGLLLCVGLAPRACEKSLVPGP